MLHEAKLTNHQSGELVNTFLGPSGGCGGGYWLTLGFQGRNSIGYFWTKVLLGHLVQRLVCI